VHWKLHGWQPFSHSSHWMQQHDPRAVAIALAGVALVALIGYTAGMDATPDE
jgi:hypothetical protein